MEFRRSTKINRHHCLRESVLRLDSNFLAFPLTTKPTTEILQLFYRSWEIKWAQKKQRRTEKIIWPEKHEKSENLGQKITDSPVEAKWRALKYLWRGWQPRTCCIFRVRKLIFQVVSRHESHAGHHNSQMFTKNLMKNTVPRSRTSWPLRPVPSDISTESRIFQELQNHIRRRFMLRNYFAFLLGIRFFALLFLFETVYRVTIFVFERLVLLSSNRWWWGTVLYNRRLRRHANHKINQIQCTVKVVTHQ
jgi:hypothetical protein